MKINMKLGAKRNKQEWKLRDMETSDIISRYPEISFRDIMDDCPSVDAMMEMVAGYN